MKHVKRKIFLLADLLVILALPGLVALNMRVVGFSEWVMLIAAGALVVMNGAYFEKADPRHFTKTLLMVLTVPVVCLALLGSYCNPYWSSVYFRHGEPTEAYDLELSPAQARADLDEAMRYLEKCHPVFGTREHLKMQKQDVLKARYKEITERLSESDGVTVTELRRDVEGLFALLGDAHTTVWSKADDRYLRSIDQRKAEGMTLAAVNGKTPAQWFEKNRALFSYEADSWGIQTLGQQFSSLGGLDYLGISPDGVTYTWQNAAGETVTDTYTADDFLPYDEYLEASRAYRDNRRKEPFVSYTIDEEKSLALLTLRSCQYNQEYIDCLREMFTQVQEKGIRNVAVDLRGNGGGNSLVANECFRYLSAADYREGRYVWRLGLLRVPFAEKTVSNKRYTSLTFPGRFYLLTDTGSFSSAMLFAQYVKDNHLGTIIGEPPGNTPAGYGETTVFRLKHSGLYCQISTKEFYRLADASADPLVMPDIPCDSADALETLYATLKKA